MKKKAVCAVGLLAALLAVMMPLSPAEGAEVITQAALEKEIVTVVDLIPMVDNFIVYFDTSSSTNDILEGTEMTKIQAAKAFLRYRNAWLPELGYKAGLFTYTPFKTVHAMAEYDRTRFGTAIDSLPVQGRGMASFRDGMVQLREVMAGLTGRTAVIIFTDGKFNRSLGPRTPLQIARDIAREHDVCFYVISSADAATQQKLETAVASISPCSRVVPFKAFVEQPYYLAGGLFVLKVGSYEKVRKVNRVVGFSMNDIYFDLNSARLQPVFEENLAKLGRFLNENPKAYAMVSGYSCNTGSSKANWQVSKARAETVSGYLIEQAQIAPERIVELWYGSANPAADNGNATGRRLNRRVEIAVAGLN